MKTKHRSNKTLKKSRLLIAGLVLTLPLLVLAGCKNDKTSAESSSSSSTKASSAVKSSASTSSSTSSSSSSTTSSSSKTASSSAAASLSQADLVNLMAAWIQNSQGKYSVQYFTDSSGHQTFTFINGGENGSGKFNSDNASAGQGLKDEKNSAQFVVDGDNVSFQVPTFPNGVTGDWNEIVWTTKETLSKEALQARFGSQVSTATAQLIMVEAGSPY
ncbi:hypothetical protein [Lactovum odontotermitis]